jgi:hypothetical protein
MKIVIPKELSGLPLIKIGKILKFQGSLKVLTEGKRIALQKSIEENGFFAPLFLWKDKNGKMYVLDGHQRLDVISEAIDDPELHLPYVLIEAKTKQEAAKKLVLITSEYGKITPEGWHGFSDTYKIEAEWFKETAATNFEFGWGTPAKVQTEWEPNYNPKKDNQTVTDQDIDEAQAPTYDNPAKYREVCCPKCAHEFKISKI